MDDNLLKANGSIRHHGENMTNDEEPTPTFENVIVITWLRLVHPDLPALINFKQRYGTELRCQTLASLKPEISQALESLLEEIQRQMSPKSYVLHSNSLALNVMHTHRHPPTPGSQVQDGKYALCVNKQTDHSFTITLASALSFQLLIANT